MAQCKACGSDNPADVRYCGKCGKPFVAADTAEATVSPRPGYRNIGLVLAGIALAGAIGYFFGAMLDNPPTADSDGTNATAPAKHKQARAAGPKPASAEATTPEGGDRNWGKMRAEMAACGKFNLFCQEKVRWHYCNGMWGKVPECPQSSSN